MPKPVVVEVSHGKTHFHYAKQKLYENLKELPKSERSVGLEASPSLIDFVNKTPDVQMGEDHKFWRDLMVHAAHLKARIIPLLDDESTRLVTSAQKYAIKAAGIKALDYSKIEKQGGKIKLSAKDAKTLLEMFGAAFARIDERLAASIPAERPAISFVGAGHGEHLRHGGLEVIEFPRELTGNLEREHLAYMRKARKAYIKRQEKVKKKN